jgi:hypothetical protein
VRRAKGRERGRERERENREREREEREGGSERDRKGWREGSEGKKLTKFFATTNNLVLPAAFLRNGSLCLLLSTEDRIRLKRFGGGGETSQ